MSQLTLTQNSADTLADFPTITEIYRRSDTKHLYIDRANMKDRAEKPKDDWDKKFAHLHVEAINKEIIDRRKPRYDDYQ